MLGRRISSSLCRRATARAASSSSLTPKTPSPPDVPHPSPGEPAPSELPSSQTFAATAPQAPNFAQPWSTNQRLRPAAGANARFEQTNMDLQPAPLSAMEMVANEPIRLVKGRKAVCDGGGGPLGHPRIYINLDKPGPRPCGYCGIRFEQEPHHGHNH